MARNYNPKLADEVRNYLNEDNWHYRFHDVDGLFMFGVNLPGNLKNIQYVVDIGEDDYIVYAVSPISADRDNPEQMQQMAEFICRVNYGLKDGGFELDFSDGELRYKCYLDCEGVIPTRNMIGKSIHCPANMFIRYSKGILQILFQGASAEEAAERCEEIPAASEGNGDDEAEEISSRLMQVLRSLKEGHRDTDGEMPTASCD